MNSVNQLSRSILLFLVMAFSNAVSSGLAQQVEAAPPSKTTPFETVTFPAGDGLTITADLYVVPASDLDKPTERPMILLFHQAGWSRGEYREIAPRLNQMGYDCLAVDQRSGKSVNQIENQTAKAATSAGKETSFVDAEQDLLAAIKFAKTNHGGRTLILWGSSYSAALVLKVAGDHPDDIDAVLAFSPGEYFKRFGKPDDWIQQSAAKIRVPVFITSAQKEVANWQEIFDAIQGKSKISFVPRTAGNHGSRALYSRFDDSNAYWDAVTQFLNAHVLTAAR